MDTRPWLRCSDFDLVSRIDASAPELQDCGRGGPGQVLGIFGAKGHQCHTINRGGHVTCTVDIVCSMYVLLPTPYICTYIHVLPWLSSARQMVPGVPSHMMPCHDASRLRCRISLPSMSAVEASTVNSAVTPLVPMAAALLPTCKYRQPTLLLHLSMAPSAGGAMQPASMLLSTSMQFPHS